jgi:predicted nuclease with RNAse H fold
VVEVCPRASLQSWDLYRPSHRQIAKTQILGCLLTDLRAKAPWLDFGAHEQILRLSRDAFDAVIAAMTAGCGSPGSDVSPGRGDLAAALAEGWIAIPDSPIDQLL